MKPIILKGISLVVILMFAVVLIPQQAEADACTDAQLACLIATLGAEWVCDNFAQFWCDLANIFRDIVCNHANDVCNP